MPTTILLLNPPGRYLYLREYYCSKVSKANYLYHPLDILMLSGRLSGRFELHVIDAIADNLDVRTCLDRIERIAPDVVISQIAAVSLEEDLDFMQRIKRADRRILVSGDIVLDNTESWLEQHPYVDAAILDFTSEDIIHYLEGDSAQLNSLVRRDEARSSLRRIRPVNKEYTVPVPRHDLFTSPRYRYPFVRHKEFATVLTDYGCPYHCSFCIMSTIGYQYRPVDNIMDELRSLKKLGKKDIYFDDQTFAVNAQRTFELCKRMEEERLDLGWVCFSRVDLLTDDLVSAMKRAGCHTIMLGVESGSDALLAAYHKGYTTEQVRETFKLCKKRGIRTVATYILGLPEETEESAYATIAFAKELDSDFASFNFAVPRVGTALRQDAIAARLIPGHLEPMDQSGLRIAMPSRSLTKEQLQKIRIRAIKGYYLRPGYLWRRITGLSSFYELREHVSEGLALLAALRKKPL